jgi:argininosuccinate synthase
MTNRFVLAYFGDRQSAASIAALADQGEVVAVALDLGDGIPLNELRDGALVAGAGRCHALDVREEFLRDAILPTLRAHTVAEAGMAVSARAATFVTAKLQAIADIEEAVLIAPERRVFPMPASSRRATAGVPAYLDLRFAQGVPVAVNEIPMTLTELTECINTIAGVPASELLHLAYRQLDGAADGQVVLRVEDGQCAVASTAVML